MCKLCVSGTALSLGRIFEWQCLHILIVVCMYIYIYIFFFFNGLLWVGLTSLVSTQRVWWWRRDSHLKLLGEIQQLTVCKTDGFMEGLLLFEWKGLFFPPHSNGEEHSQCPVLSNPHWKWFMDGARGGIKKSARKQGGAVLGFSCQ